MYVKVRKIGDKWFRDDNGALVGIDVPPGETFNYLQILVGQNRLFAKKGNKVIAIYHGYLDKNNSFIHFCNNTSCKTCLVNFMFCHKVVDEYRKKTSGYYIKSN